MAFLLKNGSVFLHIPKTGGTWIKQALDDMKLIQAPLGHMHSDWERAFWHDKLHHDLKVVRYIFRRAIRSPRAQARIAPDAFKFCFVREPLRWYESYWRFMESKDWDWKAWGDEKDPYKWHPCAMLNTLGSHDFNEFMHRVNRKRPGFVTEMYGWYVRPGIGFVGRQEYLRDDMIKALELMKVDFKQEDVLLLPKRNVTPDRIRKVEWDPMLRKATLRLEHAGYIRYGYRVDGSAETSLSPSGHQAGLPQMA